MCDGQALTDVLATLSMLAEALDEIAALPDIGYDRNDAYTIAVEALEDYKRNKYV